MFCIFHLQVFDQNNEVYAPTPASRTFNEVTSKDLYWMLSLITTLSLILDRFTKLKMLGVSADLKQPQKWMQSFVFGLLFSILQGQIIIRAACLMCGMV